LGKKVVLDPGHGGTDSGAINQISQTVRLKEKEQNLLVAEGLATLLRGDGCVVKLTRTGDTHLTNTQRANIANSEGADILVSIHMNGSTNKSVDYTTTLYGKPRKDKELAYALFGGSVKPPSYGLRTLPAAYGTGTIATRTPYQFASGVLLKSNMPAVIAESVFITNIEEGKLLNNGTGIRQDQIEEALRSGIEQYLATH
jgi:N-acetylmuramoyl-L-alanine amidase